MLAVYEVARVLHLAGGAIGLVSMFVPLCSRKGSRLHRRAGKIFAVAMIVAGLTGVGMSGSWLVFPEAFVGDDRQERINGLFLGTIGLLMLGAVQQMLRSTARKGRIEPRPTRLDVGLPVACGGFGVVTATVGVLVGGPLLIVFGALAAWTALGDLRFVLRPLPSPKAWWYQHMQGAMIAMISAITAFVVFGGRQWLGGLLPDGLRWTLWIAPSVVIVPLFTVWTARWRQRFGEHTAAMPRPSTTAG